MNFLAKINGGVINLGSDYNRARFKDFVKKNEGMRLEINPLLPESKKQRGFLEGAIFTMIAYYQEGLDYRNSEDVRKVRDWCKCEFNGEFLVIKGKSQKVAKSTKGMLNDFLERVMDWMTDQGYQTELLDPKEYKKWRDTIFPFGGPDNFLEYLEELGKLKRP
jgi:hypothetical protein